ncbi:MAG: LacI family DNA-binding transcriptional regulator, partial [Firmicutes bacterium]|nr:LacI family DNA-binding transcriptional regulator [Bacillota bacterium]
MTIRDVAEYSGVSVSTVSRVLNDHPDVSADVRERVLNAIKELHYVPNVSARDLVKSGGDSIGVVVRGADNPFFTPIITAI